MEIHSLQLLYTSRGTRSFPFSFLHSSISLLRMWCCLILTQMFGLSRWIYYLLWLAEVLWGLSGRGLSFHLLPNSCNWRWWGLNLRDLLQLKQIFHHQAIFPTFFLWGCADKRLDIGRFPGSSFKERMECPFHINPMVWHLLRFGPP